MNSVPDPQQPKPPEGLQDGGAGARLWRSVVGKYTLRPDELCILENACHLADDITHWEAEAAESLRSAGTERIVRGSTGQRRVNPLLIRADKAKAEVVKVRTAQVNMIAKLNLPDDPADPATGRLGAGAGPAATNSVA